MKKFFLKIYDYCEKRRKSLLLLLGVLICLFSVSLTFSHFSEDITNFLPQKEKQRRIIEAYQHINTTNKIVVFIGEEESEEAKSEEEMADKKKRLMEVADEFVSTLKTEDTLHLTDKIFYKVDDEEISEMTEYITQTYPTFLEEADYSRIDTLLEDTTRFREEIEWCQKMLYSPMGGAVQGLLRSDPLHISNRIMKRLSDFGQENIVKRYGGYIFDQEEKEIIITLTSKVSGSETDNNRKWIKIIDETAKKIKQSRTESLQIVHIGMSDISIGNADQIKKDTIYTSVAAMLMIAVLLLLYYRRIRYVLLILFSILFGAMFALTFLTIFKENISIISVGIGSIIVGIAANYPLHYLSHIVDGNTQRETMKEVAVPLVVGNITTVGAFLSLLFIDSEGMRDMGWFAALLLVGTIIFVLVFLPHLCGKKKNLRHNRTSITEDGIYTGIYDRIASFSMEENKWIVVSVLLLTIPMCIMSGGTKFETDLHSINYMTDEQRSTIEKMIRDTEDGYSKTYFVSEATDLNGALIRLEKTTPLIDSLRREGKIKKVFSVEGLATIDGENDRKWEKWRSYWKENGGKAKSLLIEEGSKIGFKEDFFEPFIESIVGDETEAYKDEEKEENPLEKITERFIYSDSEKTMLYTILETTKEDKDIVQEDLKKLLSSEENVYIFDDTSLYTGMVETLSEDFNKVLFVCAFIVFVFLWLAFGRIELSIISFVPLTIGWFWILGLMNLMDIRFNIVNIILATFIFGQGDDYTIFVTEGLMYEYAHKKKVLASYKKSVALSATIMFIGIGVLIFAKHPAMRSLAQVTIVGMSSVILMAYLFPPLLFKWLTLSKGENRIMPITFRNLFNTILSFTVFAFFCTIYTLLGFFMLTIGGKSERHKLKFHELVCNIFRKFVAWIPNIKHEIHNMGGYDFECPSILISNHQSHLDLLYLMILHPKIICLTNKWVWNCPFWGIIIRYMEYYPISNGVEEGLPVIAQAVSRGYSVLIFPEGTRSEDGKILRFHQGAFYLAEKLRVDIVPLIIHGISDVFPKKEFLIRKGKVDVYVYPPVKDGSPLIVKGETRKTAQNFCRFYREEYAKVSKETETPAYYKDLVYHNYIYKGASVAKEAKKNLYQSDVDEWIATLPDEGELLVESCGQGERTLLAALVKKRLNVIASEKDPDRFSIAKNCTSVPSNLKYEESSTTEQ